MKKLKAALRALIRDENGAAAVEYGLLAGLIAVVIIAGAQLVGQNLSTIFHTIGSSL